MSDVTDITLGSARFLLSRIKEEYDRSGHSTAAVAARLERAGRLVTAAAVLVAVVLGALVTSGIVYLKMLGVGLTLAVLVMPSSSERCWCLR